MMVDEKESNSTILQSSSSTILSAIPLLLLLIINTSSSLLLVPSCFLLIYTHRISHVFTPVPGIATSHVETRPVGVGGDWRVIVGCMCCTCGCLAWLAACR